MHLRRALLLFAIVLGLAALATAASRPPQSEKRSSGTPATQPTAKPAPQGAKPARVRFGPRARSRARQLEVARPTEVLVAVPEPGQVELKGLGLSAPADPLTPARFDVLAMAAGRRVQVLFTGADERAPRRLGVLSVAAR